jgi:RNA polymerase sigma-70 factor (ECF subfamily)
MFREATRESNDDLFSRLDLGPAIERALAKLPEPFQSTVKLVDIDDQPYEAAATILGIPIGTVRSRLFRGRRLMQEMLMTYARDAGYATG